MKWIAESFMQRVPREGKRDRDIPYLTEGEAFIYKWQNWMLGSFNDALMEAIKYANDKDIEKLRLGFPVEVEAWEMFKYKDGWWDGVKAKAMYFEEWKQTIEGRG